MLNIYVRKDLSMRKGKMAAQSAHAAMKLFLEVMKVEGSHLVLKEKQEKEFKTFLENPVVQIKMVASEEEFDNSCDVSQPHAFIVDNGRTEFHGVPTKTCAAQGIFSEVETHELEVPHTYGHEIAAKELFVFSKQVPLQKETSCELAVIACLKMLYSQMKTNSNNEKYVDLNESSPLSAWITGAFGKIAVSVKTDEELYALQESLKEKGFEVELCQVKENKCLVISPQYPNVIDEHTRHLSLI